jgi:hypothetical protein
MWMSRRKQQLCLQVFQVIPCQLPWMNPGRKEGVGRKISRNVITGHQILKGNGVRPATL